MTPTPNNEALADTSVGTALELAYEAAKYYHAWWSNEPGTDAAGAWKSAPAYQALEAHLVRMGAALDSALASSGQAASAVPEVAADKRVHDHMMTIACRVWESGGHETTKVLLREVCKALAADKNLLRKLAPTQPASAKAQQDTARLDWLEQRAKESRTGVHAGYARFVEDGYVTEKGYRVMSHHRATAFLPTLREAIDADCAATGGQP